MSIWSPAGRGLTSWLSFVVSYCEFVTFPLVSWVRCGTWLYQFLIFAPLLTLINIRFCQRYIMQIHNFLMQLRSRFGLLIRNNSKNCGCYISNESVICNIRLNKNLLVGHVSINSICKKSKCVWSGNTTITYCRPTHDTVWANTFERLLFL